MPPMQNAAQARPLATVTCTNRRHPYGPSPSRRAGPMLTLDRPFIWRLVAKISNSSVLAPARHWLAGSTNR